MNRFNQWMIDSGMRGGIPDPATRARTITLYLDKQRFRQALGLPDEDHIYLLLIDQDGRVYCQSHGPYSPEKAASLLAAVEGETWQHFENKQTFKVAENPEDHRATPI